jgi:hypothetical protein
MPLTLVLVIRCCCGTCRVLWSQHNTGQLLTVEEGALRMWSVADAAVQVREARV